MSRVYLVCERNRREDIHDRFVCRMVASNPLTAKQTMADIKEKIIADWEKDGLSPFENEEVECHDDLAYFSIWDNLSCAMDEVWIEGKNIDEYEQKEKDNPHM